MEQEKQRIINHLELPSETGSITKVETVIDKLCKELSLQEDYYGNMLIAITEAVNNAIEHGNNSIPEKKILIDYFEDDNGFITFRVSDEGPGFDFTNLPDPTDPENIDKPNGRGIFLMKNLADEVSFLGTGQSVEIKFALN